MNKEELHNIFIDIRNNNELQFSRLYERYKFLVYGVAFSILKNREDSEEVVQNVFTKIYKLEKEKLPKENEASWLYTFSKNMSLNYVRTKKYEINIDELYYITNEDKELNEIVDKDAYNRAILRLNKKEQEIVSLRVLSNLSFKEISNILNISIGTVQWKYYKSLHTLKMLLSSLSMYILTVLVFIMQKFANRNKQEQQETIKEEISKTEDEEQRADDTMKKEEADTESVKQEESDINKDTEETTIKEENVITNLTSLDIGLLSISFVCLTITIIFLIFFIKNQQKAKKKVSK